MSARPTQQHNGRSPRTPGSSRTLGRARFVLALAVASAAPGLLGVGTVTAAGTDGSTQGQASAPAATAGRWSGKAAIDRLGMRLPAVAAKHGLTTGKLHRELAADSSLAVDAADQLLYIDAAHGAQQLATVTATPFDPAISTDDAFTLHSSPGAARTIFLDFDGHTLSGTAWNSSTGGDCYAEPYDTDGAASFNTSERNAVIDVWKRIAEDYAAFDVDVTTADPGYDAINRSSSSDAVFGTRLLITKSVTPCSNGKTMYSSICGGGCGGIAYVGVFDNTGSGHDQYQPAIVFQNGSGSSSKSVAEAGSHEVGHNIGLSHDATASVGYYSGHGDWAPIMGVGYYEAITQWSQGEYTGANNTQDDFAVAVNNGLPLRTDDHGNTAATATALAGNPATADGVITTRTDIDAFSVVVTNAGPATISASPTPVSPNLDIRLEVVDANGTSLGVDDPASGATNGDVSTGMGATLTLDLAVGTYTVLIDGVGKGDPASNGYSDYASVGLYQLDVAVTGPQGQAPTAVATATPMRGVAPLPVTFVGSGSTDPESSTLTYSWNFGDGSAVSTEADPTHTYTTAGNYTVTLTVTDDMSLSDSTSIVINVTAPVRTIDLAALTVTGVRNSSGRLNITGVASVKDNSAANVSGASVTARWSIAGKVANSKTVTTNTGGNATFSLTNQRLSRGVVVQLCVTRVALGSTVVDNSLYAPSTSTVCTSWTVP